MYFNDKSNDNITYFINYYSNLYKSSYCNNSFRSSEYPDLISFLKSKINFSNRDANVR